MDYLRDKGYDVANIQKAKLMGGKKVLYMDAYGYADLEAYNAMECVHVQAMGNGEIRQHVEKYEADLEIVRRIQRWTSSTSRRLEFHVWSKVRPKNKDGKKGKKQIWRPRVYDVFVNGDRILVR